MVTSSFDCRNKIETIIKKEIWFTFRRKESINLQNGLLPFTLLILLQQLISKAEINGMWEKEKLTWWYRSFFLCSLRFAHGLLNVFIWASHMFKTYYISFKFGTNLAQITKGWNIVRFKGAIIKKKPFKKSVTRYSNIKNIYLLRNFINN